MFVQFVYFDLGNVLLNFSVQRLLHQVAELTAQSEETVRSVIFGDKRYYSLENGDISTRQYFEMICNEFDMELDQCQFQNAINDIFWVNDSILPVVRKLAKCFVPRGILSNTNESHWDYVQSAFPCIWDLFPRHKIASFEVKCMKPFPEFYEVALKEARTQIPSLKPEEILLIDDLEENIQGAREFGFETVHYKDTQSLVDHLIRLKLPVPTRYFPIQTDGNQMDNDEDNENCLPGMENSVKPEMFFERSGEIYSESPED